MSDSYRGTKKRLEKLLEIIYGSLNFPDFCSVLTEKKQTAKEKKEIDYD